VDADRAAVKLPKERQPLGARLKSLFTNILGWLATLVGVLVLILILGNGSGWAGSSAVVNGLVPVGVVLAVAYVVLRRYNKRRENVSEPPPVLAATRLAQSWLGRELEKIDEQNDFNFDPGSVVLSDATRITAATVAEYDGLEKIEFLWLARPSQPDDFLTSTQFAGLPASTQDAVVLLDLRRELRLRGLDAFMSASSGFYCHDMDRITKAALHTGNAGLSELLGSVRTVAPGRSVNDMTSTVLGELDKQETWEGLLSSTNESVAPTQGSIR
jgi:hypothetical protein